MTERPVDFEELRPFCGLEVVVGNMTFEEAVRRFKSMVQKSQILSEYKERQHYEKPSAKKRRKIRESCERQRIAKLREQLIASGEWDKRQKAKEQRRKEKQLKKQEERLEAENHDKR